MKLVWCVLAAVSALALGCSVGSPCGPNNCASGCCASSGECMAGTSPEACGTGGHTCDVCAGTTCEQGACTSPGGNDSGSSCGPENCTGCCQGAVCIAGANQNAVACGVGGFACHGCALGQACVDGACSSHPDGGPEDGGSCGPGNCDGCCAAGFCIPVGNENTFACGQGGQACQACSSGTCNAGACTGGGDAGTCGLGSCNGCCEGGLCLSLGQEDDSACGFAGQTCAACTNGTSCSNGFCSSPDAGSCDPSTCLGCCLGNMCLSEAQQNDFACGFFTSCAPCSAGTTCQSGQCALPPLDAGSGCGTCDGCCNGNSCVPLSQESDTQCGTGGAACNACLTGLQSCVSGTCQLSFDGGTCSILSCLEGCCLFGMCIDASTQTDFDCGLLGQTCGLCDTGTTCSGGLCVSPDGG